MLHRPAVAVPVASGHFRIIAHPPLNQRSAGSGFKMIGEKEKDVSWFVLGPRLVFRPADIVGKPDIQPVSITPQCERHKIKYDRGDRQLADEFPILLRDECQWERSVASYQ